MYFPKTLCPSTLVLIGCSVGLMHNYYSGTYCSVRLNQLFFATLTLCLSLIPHSEVYSSVIS